MHKRVTYTLTSEEIVNAVCVVYKIPVDVVKGFLVKDSNFETAVDITDKTYAEFVTFVLEVNP